MAVVDESAERVPTPAHRSFDGTSNLGPYAIFACMAIVIAGGMYFAFPLYDDTLLRIFEVESGPQMLSDSHGDQPLTSFLWRKLAEQGVLWPVGIALNTLAWLVIGAFTYYFYRQFLYDSAIEATAASVLAMAPIFTEIQFVILSTGVLIVGSTAACCTATYLMTREGRVNRPLFTVIGAAAAFVGNLFYFYGVPCIAAGATVLAVRSIVRRKTVSPVKDLLYAGILIVAGAAGFFVYYKTADLSWRSGDSGAARVDAEVAKKNFTYVGPRLPVLLLDGLWKCTLGGLGREAGQLGAKGKPAYCGIAFGVAIALLSWRLVGRKMPSTEQAEPDPVVAHPKKVGMQAAQYCVPALVMGMLPILIMGRPLIDETMLSRLLTPLAPYASCLTVALLTLLTRGSSLPRSAAYAILFLAGARTATEAYEEYRDRQILADQGRQLRQRMHPTGYTVAVFLGNAGGKHAAADDSLTAQLTEDFSLEQRLRFWATPKLGATGPVGTTLLRGVRRPSTVDRYLIVVPDDVGNLTILEVPPDDVRTETVKLAPD